MVELNTSTRDADWIKYVGAGRAADLQAHDDALKIHQEREKKKAETK